MDSSSLMLDEGQWRAVLNSLEDSIGTLNKRIDNPPDLRDPALLALLSAYRVVLPFVAKMGQDG